MAALLALPGCESIEQFYSTRLPVGGAIDWWHDLQGGVIADERPAPPGADDPYPGIDTVPARPAPSSAVARKSLLDRLAADRDRTQRLAAQDPIVPPPKPGAAAVAPDAPAPASTGRFEAAAAPPPAVAAPPPAAVSAPAAIQAAAAPEPRRPAPPPNVLPDFPAPPPPAVVSGPVPPLPTAPPAVPSLAGMPAGTFAPATPRPAPQVVVGFLPRSAVLRPESDAALRALAARRGGGQVALLGGGDAASAAPDMQQAALPLAWRRARAIADVLAAAGVPATAMQMDAAALGRGGIVRLVQ